MTVEPARYYTTRQACSCPDWYYRGSRAEPQRPCKHMVELVWALAVLERNLAKWKEEKEKQWNTNDTH